MTSSTPLQVAAVDVICAGCASLQTAQDNRNEIVELRAQIDALEPKLRRVADLELRVVELTRQVDALNKRLGRRRVRPQSKVEKVDAVGAMKLVSKTYMTGVGDRGQKRSLRDALQRYDGVVVGYWATWCKPCISDEELNHLRTLRASLSAANVALVSLAIDDLSDVQGHAKADRWLYPLWHGVDAHMDMLPKRFIEKVGLGLPLFVVASRDGRIRYFYKDKLTTRAVRDLVRVASRL